MADPNRHAEIVASLTGSERATIYDISSVGAWCAVCAPIGMQREVVERQVNALHRHCSRRWRIAPMQDDNGGPAPCPCEFDATRLHWLLISEGAA